jgi:F-box and leucine-rich repeat protein 2/20
MNFVVRPQLKSLGLACNWLRDKNIKRLASIFPNLQLLNLSRCYNISNEGIFHVLRRCGNIRHLNLAYGVVTLEGLNFEVPKLEVLNLSFTNVDD